MLKVVFTLLKFLMDWCTFEIPVRIQLMQFKLVQLLRIYIHCATYAIAHHCTIFLCHLDFDRHRNPNPNLVGRLTNHIARLCRSLRIKRPYLDTGEVKDVDKKVLLFAAKILVKTQVWKDKARFSLVLLQPSTLSRVENSQRIQLWREFQLKSAQKRRRWKNCRRGLILRKYGKAQAQHPSTNSPTEAQIL